MGKLILAIIVGLWFLARNAEKKETARCQDEWQARREERLAAKDFDEDSDDDFSSGVASQW